MNPHHVVFVVLMFRTLTYIIFICILSERETFGMDLNYIIALYALEMKLVLELGFEPVTSNV